MLSLGYSRRWDRLVEIELGWWRGWVKGRGAEGGLTDEHCCWVAGREMRWIDGNLDGGFWQRGGYGLHSARGGLGRAGSPGLRQLRDSLTLETKGAGEQSPPHIYSFL